jgi:hypothetical protein
MCAAQSVFAHLGKIEGQLLLFVFFFIFFEGVALFGTGPCGASPSS